MLYHYVLTALRSIRSSPYVAAINVFGLALGLACFIGAFTAVQYIESSDRQFTTADRAYAITQRVYSQQRGFDSGSRPSTSPPIAGLLREELPGLEAVARIEQMLDIDVAVGENKAQLAGVVADNDFLKVFPFELLPGAAADVLDQPRSVVLTASTATRLFGTTDVVGKTLTLRNAVDVRVTAVISHIPAPSQFDDSPLTFLRFDMLVSWDVLDELTFVASGQRPSQMPEVMQWGRIAGPTYVLLPKSGAISAEMLNATLAGFEKYVPKERRSFAAFEFKAIPAFEVWKTGINSALFRGSDISVTTLLQVLGGLILSIACLNYANLAAAGIAARLKETGMRRVLGASGTQVATQSIVEAVVLSAAALVIAVATLAALSPLVRKAAGIDLLSALSGLAIWISVGASMVAASLLAGAYPAIVMARVRPAGAMRQRWRGHSMLAARLLVGAQFAAASFLLIAVIVVFAQGRELRETGLGTESDRTLLITNRLTETGVQFGVLRDELQQLGGVDSVAAIDLLPWGFSSSTILVSRTPSQSQSSISPYIHAVTPAFDATMGMRLLAGRSFDETRADDFFAQRFPTGFRSLDTSRTYGVMVDRQLARGLGWANPQEAVNQIVHLPLQGVGLQNVTVRIIGVLEDKPLRLFGVGSTSNVFISTQQVTGYPLIRIRETADIPATLRQIESVWQRLSPDTLLQRRFLDEQFDLNYRIFERINRVITGVTVLAFLISVMGLFGMAAFIASRRRHEIGVRKTLGAGVGQILAMLLKDFSKPVVVANLAIWPLGYLIANAYLGVFTHRMTLTPVPFIASLALTVLVAWLAVGGQAWRAARLKPATVLRYE